MSAEARAADYSGLEASDTARVRITAVGRGLVAGEVYDDTSGLPLEGATVLLSGGCALRID